MDPGRPPTHVGRPRRGAAVDRYRAGLPPR